MNTSDLVITKNDTMRESILAVESTIRAVNAREHLEEPYCPLDHTFAPGAYARTIFIPQGVLVVGKIHRHAHLNILIRGRVSVATEEGPMLLEAPLVMTSKAGTKRVVYTHTDTMWTTVHVTDSTDLDEIEAQIIAKDYAAFDSVQDASVLQLLEFAQAHDATMSKEV